MTTQHATAEMAHFVNGINVQAALDTIEALKADKSLAQFQFRARNTWVSGGENRSTIRDFFGAGREDTSRTAAFEFTNGEPPVLLGNNEGANPVEFLLHALAGCVTTTFVLHAMARGITIHRMSTELMGDIDLQGLLGLDETVPAGYRQINIRMQVDADCSEEELDDLLAYAQQHSPVCNTVCRPVPVVIERVMA
ncbi:OsmC family protein [Aquibaculum sediminis]|uniref:OsmC family protein n=1 Tax=Aquibaculum sediminis TaxID=3231907 RepID=UPI003452BDA4